MVGGILNPIEHNFLVEEFSVNDVWKNLVYEFYMLGFIKMCKGKLEKI